MGPEHAWWGGMWFFPILMPIIMLILLAILFSMFTGRGFFRSSGQNDYGSYQHSTESPLDILKKRYAKGEINKDEFERMKKDIV